MKELSFHKAVATGNDFIIIENHGYDDKTLRELAILLCRPKYGVGADGLLVAEGKKDFLRMRIFNPDGSEAEMCGNGIRCFALWAYKERKVNSSSFKVHTLAGIIECKVLSEHRVRVRLGKIVEIKRGIKINYQERLWEGDYLDTGVPHFVIEVDDLENIDVKKIGSFFRHHKRFQPRGTNVDFVQYRDDKLYIRTYERGVEDETLACGTGCIASAVAFGLRRDIQGAVDITLVPKSGETLKISYILDKDSPRDIWLEADVRILFQGKLMEV